jgi:hypothetical protein
MRDPRLRRELQLRQRAAEQRGLVRLKHLKPRRRLGGHAILAHPLTWHQSIVDKMNEYDDQTWETPREMIFALLAGNPLRKTLANYFSSIGRWDWIKRCTVCRTWFTSMRGERCSRVCTDQWWSRARRNNLPSARRGTLRRREA